jgi:hypothetical protein
MAAQTTCCQVIDGDGSFNEQEVDAFVHQHGVIEARTNYQVVAIMGPQSSGKSTLMNHVVSNGLVSRLADPSRVPVLPAVDHALQLVLLLTGSRLQLCIVKGT